MDEDATALATLLFGEEPETVPGVWYYAGTGAQQWAPDPEGT